MCSQFKLQPFFICKNMRTSIAFLLLMPLASASILRGSEQDNGNFISRLLGGSMGTYSVSTGHGGGSGVSFDYDSNAILIIVSPDSFFSPRFLPFLGKNSKSKRWNQRPTSYHCRCCKHHCKSNCSAHSSTNSHSNSSSNVSGNSVCC
jgi:hypothetical protein